MSTIRSTSTPSTGHTAQPAKQAQTVTPSTPTASGAKPSCEHIAQRAYEKWMKRGCVHGYDVQDWAEAEKEVMAEQSRTTTPSSTGTRR